MSLRWAILGSGSQANSYFFQDGDEGVVIDNGFPLRTFKKRAAKAGLNPNLIGTVLLTHTHGDHVRGVENLLLTTGALLVHRQGLKIDSIIRRWKEPTLAVDTLISYSIGTFDFLPFDLSHDAPAATG
jgi:glyoxylase-like metal-dependent hydrolase (beta-lactamase superfamily II)